MRLVKFILNGLFAVLLLLVLALPIVLLFRISQAEIEKYTVPSAPVLQQTAVGGIVQAYETDMEESFLLEGVFVSAGDGFVELDYEQVRNVRWLVKIGDEIQQGQEVGITPADKILSTHNGILTEIHTDSSENCYLRVQLFSPVVLSCRIDAWTLSVLQKSHNLVTSENEPVSLVYASQLIDDDGMVDVLVSIESEKYSYGQSASFRITTGRSFKSLIVLPKNCLYQKFTNGPWYVRQVTENGIFIAERQVKIEMQDGSIVAVSGISEGEYFDSGYKAIVGGS